MQRFKLVHLALATIVASALIAGCSGGSKSSMPPVTQQASGKAVGVTLSFLIGSASQSAARTPQAIPQGTQSIVIKYQGDNPNSTPIPGGANPPSTAPTAGTVNVTVTTTSPPPPGQCVAVGVQYQCTVSVAIPVGVDDIYILAYSGQNGTGTLLASSVTTVQVNANGSLTTPGTTTPATLNTLVQNIGVPGSMVSFVNAAGFGVTPGGVLPNPQATPTAIPSGSWAAGQQTAGSPFSYSAGQGITVKAADGTLLGANQPIPSGVTIASTDTSGNTCLVYEKAGATSATPCPFTSAGKSVTLSNTSDMYAVLYNNKFVPGAGFTLTAAFPNASATPSPQPVTISAAVVPGPSPSPANMCCGQSNLVWDPISSKVYESWHDYTGGQLGATPLAAMPYSSAAGYGAPVPVTVTSVNGAAGILQGDTVSTTIGPDNNIWFTEYNGYTTTHYVGVYVLNSGVVAPVTGNPVVSPGAGKFVEFTLQSTESEERLGIATYGGYIWVYDNSNTIWRINPATATVYPNLGTSYNTAAGANTSQPITNAAGTISYPCCNPVEFHSNMIVLNGLLYIAEEDNDYMVQITPDTSPAPSNKCVNANPNPCIATAVVSTNSMSSAAGAIITDGTNVYVNADGLLQQLNPSLVITTANSSWNAGYSGLAQGADGWFWAVQDPPSGGATWVSSLSATSAGSTPAAPAGCHISYTSENGTGFILGPDKTLLMGGAGGSLPFCAVVY